MATLLKGREGNRPPLYFNESGVSMGENRAEQAQQVVKKFAFAMNRGAIGFNWFVMKMGHENGYAMVDSKDSSPFPVVASYNVMVRQLRGRKPEAQIGVAEGYWLLPFSNDEGVTLVGWEENPFSRGDREMAAGDFWVGAVADAT